MFYFSILIMSNIITLFKNNSFNSWIIYKPEFFKLTNDEFEELKNMMPTTTHQVKIYDKLVNLPRLQLCFGQSYQYSGTTSHAIQEIPPIIKKAMNMVNAHYMKSTKSNIPIYKMCLVNYYRNGKDYIGFHSDDEKQLIPNTPIYSISLGSKRKFKLKIKDKFESSQCENKLDSYEIEPEDTSLLIMGGTCQKTHKHSVPKTSKDVNLRINLTFRAFNN